MFVTDEEGKKRFEEAAAMIVAAGKGKGVQLRLLGALAFKAHCPQFSDIQATLNRGYTDIDFAGYAKEASKVKALFGDLHYKEDHEVNIYFGATRLIFNSANGGPHADVFFDKLDFCHPIPWLNRLEADFPTIPLAELLMEKMQIVKINEKDIIDTIMLLREHPIGEGDVETINANRISQLCASEWGLWRTLTMNLEKVRRMMQVYPSITAEDQDVIGDRIDTLLQHIDAEPKPLSWKLRAKVGDKRKWYKDVEEVEG